MFFGCGGREKHALHPSAEYFFFFDEFDFRRRRRRRLFLREPSRGPLQAPFPFCFAKKGLLTLLPAPLPLFSPPTLLSRLAGNPPAVYTFFQNPFNPNGAPLLSLESCKKKQKKTQQQNKKPRRFFLLLSFHVSHPSVSRAFFLKNFAAENWINLRIHKKNKEKNKEKC